MLHQNDTLAVRDIDWRNFVRNIFLLDIPVADMQIMKMVRLLRTGATCKRTVVAEQRKVRRGTERQRLRTPSQRYTLTATSQSNSHGHDSRDECRSLSLFPQPISRLINSSRD